MLALNEKDNNSWMTQLESSRRMFANDPLFISKLIVEDTSHLNNSPILNNNNSIINTLNTLSNSPVLNNDQSMEVGMPRIGSISRQHRRQTLVISREEEGEKVKLPPALGKQRTVLERPAAKSEPPAVLVCHLSSFVYLTYLSLNACFLYN
jgi:hypothetical protein